MSSHTTPTDNEKSKEVSVEARSVKPSPLSQSAVFLSEINGADVKSLLRKRRDEITKSLTTEPAPSPQPEVKPTSAQPVEVSVVGRSHKQPTKNLDLLQRRKLLFIESSESESSDWDMSD